jgi:hypothetical protein
MGTSGRSGSLHCTGSKKTPSKEDASRLLPLFTFVLLIHGLLLCLRPRSRGRRSPSPFRLEQLALRSASSRLRRGKLERSAVTAQILRCHTQGVYQRNDFGRARNALTAQWMLLSIIGADFGGWPLFGQSPRALEPNGLPRRTSVKSLCCCEVNRLAASSVARGMVLASRARSDLRRSEQRDPMELGR